MNPAGQLVIKINFNIIVCNYFLKRLPQIPGNVFIQFLQTSGLPEDN